MIKMQKLTLKNIGKTLVWIGVIVCLSFTAFGQKKRDNMTDKEDMQVREADEIDLRMKVYVKIIDRRLLAITNPNPAMDAQVQKEYNTWGEIRTGDSRDLYWDIQKTLEEAIGKIDDAAERDAKNPLFGKAVHILADACKKWLPQLKESAEKSSSEKEKGVIANSIDFCEQIIEASAKVPKEEPKKKKT